MEGESQGGQVEEEQEELVMALGRKCSCKRGRASLSEAFTGTFFSFVFSFVYLFVTMFVLVLFVC